MNGGSQARPVAKHSIVVCPSSLTNNWAAEVRKWLGPERCQVMVVQPGAEAKNQASQWHYKPPCHAYTSTAAAEALWQQHPDVCNINAAGGRLQAWQCLEDDGDLDVMSLRHPAAPAQRLVAAQSNQLLDLHAVHLFMLQVISYETVRKFAETLAGTCELLVCDEGHRSVGARLGISRQYMYQVYACPFCQAPSDNLRPSAG